jgi:general secretion pathway protein J
MSEAQTNESGFTLVEMLVALALLSIMTLYAWQSFSTLQRFKLIADRVGSQMEVDAAARQMTMAISDTRGVLGHDVNNQPLGTFKGQPNRIEFIATSDGERETGGFYVVTYSVDDKARLISTHRLFRENEILAETKITLLRNVKSLSFKYLYQAPNEQNLQVSNTWEGKLTSPWAVEVNVEFEEGDKRKWPATLSNIATAFMQPATQ